MFFEDEKDFIENEPDVRISDDGTVTWDDVLNDDEDLVSVKSPALDKKDDFEQDDFADTLSDSEEIVQESPKKRAFDAFGNEPAGNYSQDDYDIDEQLARTNLNDNRPSTPIRPRKAEVKQPNSTPLLLAVLFAVLVVAGVYYILNFTKGKNVNDPNLSIASVQEQMNNISQEDIEQRTQQQDENAIPVVNEEETNTIKPDVQVPDEEEKKQVVDVKNSGRPNPFLPIAKYITSDIPQTNIDYDRAGIPRPPEAYGVKDEVTTKMLSIVVSGILYDDVKPSAIITLDENDYFVQKGDKLDDYRVVDISRNSVALAIGKNVYRAKIGEEFKISSKFYGSAQYLPSKQGGGRQYYSVVDQSAEKSTNGSGLRYVSEDEVEVKAR